MAHIDPENADSEQTASWAVRVLRRRALVIVACVLVAVGAALAYSLHQPKEYTATASLLFNNNQVGQQVAGLAAIPSTDTQSRQDTNVQLLKLGDLAQRTARQVGGGLTKSAVADGLSVSPQGDTTVVNLSATMRTPNLAANVANAYGHIFVTEQENANHAFYSRALKTVDRQLSKLSLGQQQSAQALSLQSRAQSLATLAQLQSGVVQLAQSASPPSSPSSPKTKLNVILAGLIGLVIGLFLAFAVERHDQRIREPEELERIYRLPVLGLVPESGELKNDSPDPLPQGSTAAAFQFIRAHLRYFNVDRDVRTLLVVSSSPSDGKTTVARRLAEAAAAMGARTLMVEGDLRRPVVAQKLRIKPKPGLAEVLIGAIPVEHATQTITIVSQDGAPSDDRTLDVLVAGALPPNPAEMLESHAMGALLADARSRYDLVVVDTAPLVVVSDAIPLLHKVDGVLIVTRMGRNRRDEAKRLRDRLLAAKAPAIGVVANRVRPGDTPSYGDYGYGYTGRLGGRASRTRTSQNGDERETARAPVAPRGD